MRYRSFWALAAGAHLLVAALGAAHLWRPGESFLGRLAGTYSQLSGTGVGFGYFAPEIDTELRARFVLSLRGGGEKETFLHAGLGREAVLRINSIVCVFGKWMRDEAGRRRVVASWAGKMFARHPEASRVRVLLEDYALPSMEGYRHGDRPFWRPVYRATFAIRDEGRHYAE